MFGTGLTTQSECLIEGLERSPSALASEGIRALRAHSEGRRPTVGHSCGVRRPAHNTNAHALRNKSG